MITSNHRITSELLEKEDNDNKNSVNLSDIDPTIASNQNEKRINQTLSDEEEIHFCVNLLFSLMKHRFTTQR